MQFSSLTSIQLLNMPSDLFYDEFHLTKLHVPIFLRKCLEDFLRVANFKILSLQFSSLTSIQLLNIPSDLFHDEIRLTKLQVEFLIEILLRSFLRVANFKILSMQFSSLTSIQLLNMPSDLFYDEFYPSKHQVPIFLRKCLEDTLRIRISKF